MFRGKKKTEQEEDTSKITKVILKDLKGIRVVHHKFHEKNKQKFGDEQKETREIKKKPWWRTAYGGWMITTGTIMLIFSIIAIATWESIFNGNKHSVVIQKMKQPKVVERNHAITVRASPKLPPVKTTYYPPVKTATYQNKKKNTIYQPPVQKARYNEKNGNKIYGWIDEQGKEHYTNIKGNIRKSQPIQAKKEISGYTVKLNSGKKIYCKKIYKIQKGVLRIIARNIEWELYTSEIERIEERSRINHKEQIKFIRPDDI